MGSMEARYRVARWTSFGLCIVLGSVGAAIFGLKWMLFYFLPGFAIVTDGEDRQLPGVVGVVLGSVGAAVLGLPCWVLSWIVPIVSFATMENWKRLLVGVEPILVGLGLEPVVVLLGLERLVLIGGVAVLGLEWMLAFNVAIVVVQKAMVLNSWEMGKEMAVALSVGIVGTAVIGFKWVFVWIVAIVAVVILPILVYALSVFVLYALIDALVD